MLHRLKQKRARKSNIPPHLQSTHQGGFTLIEGLVAAMIVGLGFVGIYGLSSVAINSMHTSVIRQKLQLQANQILDIIDSDRVNIALYTMDLKTCVAAAGSDTWEIRKEEWCERLAAETGIAQDNDLRQITVDTQVDGNHLVTVELEAENGAITIVMRRSYGS